MCIYPMDSPGGYQLVGRTLPIWNTFGRAGPFTADKPWLLEFFDQVRPLLIRDTLALHTWSRPLSKTWLCYQALPPYAAVWMTA
jgi:allophanate hydrolase subunit 1